MPTYQFTCSDCGDTTLQSFSIDIEAPSINCGHCGTIMRKEYENYRRENQVLTLLQCEYLWMKLDLQIIYYNQCKKLTLKQNGKG